MAPQREVIPISGYVTIEGDQPPKVVVKQLVSWGISVTADCVLERHNDLWRNSGLAGRWSEKCVVVQILKAIELSSFRL